MSYPIERKLVIAVSSSALFDLSESDKVFREQGSKKYKVYQQKNIDTVLAKGVAFPFVRRFLSINQHFKDQHPVEVILLSKNSAVTGQRVFRSIQHYQLDISRAAFMEGKSPYAYIPAFNASLFLSANAADVIKAINSGYPAGIVLPTTVVDNLDDSELRIAFDFDGVIADDESESVFRNEELAGFTQHEIEKSHIPHNPGPLADLFKKLAFMQKLEDKAQQHDENYRRILRTAIITARSAPAHERVITTLENWGVSANETFFLGGMKKENILKVLKPHLFFDDQKSHLHSEASGIAMVHIPFGVANAIKN